MFDLFKQQYNTRQRQLDPEPVEATCISKMFWAANFWGGGLCGDDSEESTLWRSLASCLDGSSSLCWSSSSASTALPAMDTLPLRCRVSGTASPSPPKKGGDAAGVSHAPAPVLHREGLFVGPLPTEEVQHVEPGGGRSIIFEPSGRGSLCAGCRTLSSLFSLFSPAQFVRSHWNQPPLAVPMRLPVRLQSRTGVEAFCFHCAWSLIASWHGQICKGLLFSFAFMFG